MDAARLRLLLQLALSVPRGQGQPVLRVPDRRRLHGLGHGAGGVDGAASPGRLRHDLPDGRLLLHPVRRQGRLRPRGHLQPGLRLPRRRIHARPVAIDSRNFWPRSEISNDRRLFALRPISVAAGIGGGRRHGVVLGLAVPGGRVRVRRVLAAGLLRAGAGVQGGAL